MAIGPCLCGDIYCPRCGNPEQAAYADAIEDLCEELEKMKLSDMELELFKSVGIEAVKQHRIIASELQVVSRY